MSNLNRNFKSLFIHVPKCAGSSMECGIAPWCKGSGHYTYSDYISKYPKIVPDCFKWTFVRNPYDRIASCWSSIYHVSCKKPGRGDIAGWSPLILKYKTLNSTFEVFLEKLYAEKAKLQNSDGLRWGNLPKLNLPHNRAHFFPMLGMMKHKGEFNIDFVGKLENIEQDWAKVCEKFKQEVTLKKNNTHLKKFGGKVSYTDMYTDHLRGIVRELYKEDFEAFQYEV